MGHQNKLLVSIFVAALCGCGVKGRPLPPLNPTPLGRGEPTFKDATQVAPDGKRNHHFFHDQDAEEEAESDAEGR